LTTRIGWFVSVSDFVGRIPNQKLKQTPRSGRKGYINSTTYKNNPFLSIKCIIVKKMAIKP
jgi:hypothetical protein